MLRRVFVLLALLFVIVAPAQAETRQLNAKPSSAQLASACGAAGGSFVDNSDIDAEFGGYSCTKKNCDGKGGECSVTCGNTGCSGTTPDRVTKPHSLVGLLQNGSEVVRDPRPSGPPQSLSETSPRPNKKLVIIW